jgi:hypothetical protein
MTSKIALLSLALLLNLCGESKQDIIGRWDSEQASSVFPFFIATVLCQFSVLAFSSWNGSKLNAM